jgi:RimJ/RimL family protein N-acetyltransferase
MTGASDGEVVTLRGAHVLLRPYRDEDEEAVARNATSRGVWRNMHEAWPHPYTRADAREWIALATRPGESTCHFAIERDGEYIGGAGLSALDDAKRILAG